jgi:uncharacterized tellurite resistance protein B-like protein
VWSRYHDILLLLVSTAVIDGELNSYEQEAIRVRLKSWRPDMKPQKQSVLVSDVLGKLGKKRSGAALQRMLTKSCEHFSQRVTDPELRWALAQHCADVASADGTLHPSARGVVAQVVTGLGVTGQVKLRGQHLIVEQEGAS